MREYGSTCKNKWKEQPQGGQLWMAPALADCRGPTAFQITPKPGMVSNMSQPKAGHTEALKNSDGETGVGDIKRPDKEAKDSKCIVMVP